MKTIAITGASGFIGKHLLDELIRIDGYEIRILVRNKQKALSARSYNEKVTVVEGDLDDLDSLRSFLKKDCTVVNLAYLWNAGEAGNVRVAGNLVDACVTTLVRRLIHCSTTAVAGRISEIHVTEETTCQPILEYATTKLKIEETIVERSRGRLDSVILRPTWVFGIEGQSLRKLSENLVQGKWWLNYLRSCLFGKRPMNLVHVRNMAAAILFFIESSKQFDGEKFIISDDDIPENNFSHVEQFLMQKFMLRDYPLPRFQIPLGVLQFLLIILGKNSVYPHRIYDSGKLRATGFDRKVSFEQGLTEYADWYCSTYLNSDRGKS